jgi:hypothetical protein
LGVEAQVIDLKLDLGDALYTHTKRKTSVYLGVYTKVAEHIRVYHATTQYLYPATVFTKVATTAATYGAGDIHLGTGLCEGEVRWTETHLGIGAKHLCNEVVKCLFEVGKGYVFVNIQSLELVKETVCTSRYGFVAVYPTWANDPNW